MGEPFLRARSAGVSAQAGDIEEALLGKVPDDEIAQRFGRTPESVKVQRGKRNIPKVDPRYKPWTPEQESLLGTAPDPEVAKRLGRKGPGVAAHRSSLGIPAFVRPRVPKPPSWRPPKPRGPSRPFTAAEDRLIGQGSDAEVAAALGRAFHSIIARRYFLKRPKFAAKVRPWTREEEELLGTIEDRKFARRFRRTYHAVAARRLMKGISPFNPGRKPWRPVDDQILGTRPDDQIAKLLGRSLSSVKERRSKLGIPNRWSRRPTQESVGPRRRCSSWARHRTHRSPANSAAPLSPCSANGRGSRSPYSEAVDLVPRKVIRKLPGIRRILIPVSQIARMLDGAHCQVATM